MTDLEAFEKACERAFKKMIRHARSLQTRLAAQDPAAFTELGQVCGTEGARAGMTPIEVTYWSARVLFTVLQETVH